MRTIEAICGRFSLCKLKDFSGVDLNRPFCFAARTDHEYSLVCPTEMVPEDALVRDDGWRAFRVQGSMEFSLVGILAKISAVLAAEKISIFAVSTYDTDYVLVHEADFKPALQTLKRAGYGIAHSD